MNYFKYLEDFLDLLQEVQPLAAEHVYDPGNMQEASRAQKFTDHGEYYIIPPTDLIVHLGFVPLKPLLP